MMTRIKVVRSARSFAFGERGFLQKNGKLIKMSRDKDGRVWRGWRKGTKY